MKDKIPVGTFKEHKCASCDQLSQHKKKRFSTVDKMYYHAWECQFCGNRADIQAVESD